MHNSLLAFANNDTKFVPTEKPSVNQMLGDALYNIRKAFECLCAIHVELPDGTSHIDEYIDSLHDSLVSASYAVHNVQRISNKGYSN